MALLLLRLPLLLLPLALAQTDPPTQWDLAHHLNQSTNLAAKVAVQHNWNYHDPQNWGAEYPQCRWQRQSPIDFCPEDIQLDEAMRPLYFQGFSFIQTGLLPLNNGHTVQVNLPPYPKLKMSGAKLPRSYILKQFHFHWAVPAADGNDTGSEHAVGGKKYAGEIHLVHLREDLPNFSRASKEKDGIAVLAVFLHHDPVLHHPTSALSPITTCLENKKLDFKNENCTIRDFSLDRLLPPSRENFWTYYGSLTTPPCSQAVLWTVMTDPLPVSTQTLLDLSHIHSNTLSAKNSEEILFNDRPTQPVHGRPILMRRPLQMSPCPKKNLQSRANLMTLSFGLLGCILVFLAL